MYQVTFYNFQEESGGELMARGGRKKREGKGRKELSRG
jgi:hypothetical protein